MFHLAKHLEDDARQYGGSVSVARFVRACVERRVGALLVCANAMRLLPSPHLVPFAMKVRCSFLLCASLVLLVAGLFCLLIYSLCFSFSSPFAMKGRVASGSAARDGGSRDDDDDTQLMVTLADVVSCILCTVTFHANHAHNLTRSP